MTYLREHARGFSYLALILLLLLLFSMGLVAEEFRLLITVLSLSILSVVHQLCQDLAYRSMK